jgi:hypothetical protein
MNVDERIEQIKARKGTQASVVRKSDFSPPDAKTGETTISTPAGIFQIEIRDGQDVLEKPKVARAGQIDASVPSALTGEEIAAQRAARAAAPPKAASKISMDYVPGPEYLELEIGSLILRTSHVEGWERRFTFGAGTWQVVRDDGSVVTNEGAVMQLVIEELQAMAAEKAARKPCATCGR